MVEGLMVCMHACVEMKLQERVLAYQNFTIDMEKTATKSTDDKSMMTLNA